MQVKIMSGISGAGKSSWAVSNYPTAMVLSTDHKHFDPDGVYRFKADKLGDFHDLTLREFAEVLAGVRAWVSRTFHVLEPDNRVLVVDNTNVRIAEIAPYYRLAKAFGHPVEVVRLHCDPGVAAVRNVHSVPRDKVWEMFAAFEPLPRGWNVRHVFQITPPPFDAS